MSSTCVLDAHYEAFAKSQVEQGRYDSVSEVICDGLRVLEERERYRAVKLEALRVEIQKGIDSGPGIPAEEVFARLEAKYQKMVQDQAQRSCA